MGTFAACTVRPALDIRTWKMMLGGLQLSRRQLQCEQQELSDNFLPCYYARVSSVILYIYGINTKVTFDFKYHGQLMLRGFDAGFSDEFINRGLIDIEDRIVVMGKN